MNWNNKEEVLKELNQGSSKLWMASDELKDDKEVVLAAIANDGSALIEASERLRADKEITFNNVLKTCRPSLLSSMYDLQRVGKEYFPEGSKVLAVHTGGLQGNQGINQKLKQANKKLIV